MPTCDVSLIISILISLALDRDNFYFPSSVQYQLASELYLAILLANHLISFNVEHPQGLVHALLWLTLWNKLDRLIEECWQLMSGYV
jgi:hypothetical protein